MSSLKGSDVVRLYFMSFHVSNRACGPCCNPGPQPDVATQEWRWLPLYAARSASHRCGVQDFGVTLTLCLFRHGRTEWNALGRYQGQHDIDLDQHGALQTERAANRVAQIQPNALYSSDLRRCKAMADLVTEHTGLLATLDQRLRERNFGAWSGCTREEMQARFPDQYDRWIHNDRELRPEGGETSREVCDRASTFLREITERHEDETVVAITHGGWIIAAVECVVQLEATPRPISVPRQASLTTLLYREGRWSLDALNDRGHLAPDAL